MTKQELIEKLESEEIPISVFGVDVDPLVVEGKLNLILKYLKEGDSRGTDVMYDGVYQEIVNFISDSQAQINSLKESIAGNIDGIAHLNDLKLDKTECTLQFNQMFNTITSTLPSGSGLTITNIFGGHHIEGTTDSQYYHTMYNIDTINGHKYYFAANFSDIKDVYIVGKIDSSSFNTKGEKLFTGGDNFIITLQIERDKVINTDLKPILVDLTEMFGIENEPQTEQEVQEYIVKGVYYPHTEKLTDTQYESIGEIDAIKGIALQNQSDVTELSASVLANTNQINKLFVGSSDVVFEDLEGTLTIVQLWQSDTLTANGETIAQLSEGNHIITSYGNSIIIDNTYYAANSRNLGKLSRAYFMMRIKR